MSEHRYLDLFLTEEDHMAKEMFRNFVEKEIMPARQKIDDDKEYKIVNKILQGLTDLGVQKAAFPKEYGGRIGEASGLSYPVDYQRGEKGGHRFHHCPGRIPGGLGGISHRFLPEGFT
jgi:alkylation response protein AidB-like acyl-CoA dehydrogenase